jgi:L-malate glycosyltransferase
LKILQLIQKPQLRGAEIFAAQLSTHLLALGHEVKLCTLFDGEEIALPFAGETIHLNRKLSQRLWDYSGWKQLAQLIKTFQPDVVQSNAGDTLKFAVMSKLLFGWKAKLIFRNANKVSDFINSTPQLLFNKFLMRHVQHVISVSELCRQDFISTYKYPETKITTVPIGLNLEPVNNNIPTDLQSFFSSGKILVHAGSFVPEKNHAGLLRIIQKLVAHNADVKVILMGDGKRRPTIEQQVIDMKLTDRIFFAGYRTDVLSIMANAHAFVLPSLIEGLPGVILEAMYCKTPVVAYDVGGVSEVVRNNETGLPVEGQLSPQTGWLVNKNDEAGFVAAVEEVLSGNEVNRITANAYALVVKEYDNREVARRFVEVYEKLEFEE